MSDDEIDSLRREVRRLDERLREVSRDRAKDARRIDRLGSIAFTFLSPILMGAIVAACLIAERMEGWAAWAVIGVLGLVAWFWFKDLASAIDDVRK